MKNDQIIIEIGCGEKKLFEQSIALDIRKTKIVDIIGNAKFLPLKNASVDYIYSSHTIEHFSHTEIHALLKEWTRILKSGGIIELRCPDLRIRTLLFFLHPCWQHIKYIYGRQDYPENTHRCGFSYNILKSLLISVGINKVKRIYDGYIGIPLIPRDLHVVGKK
jgi:predicted SAM-dependent methyltransferase